MCLVSKKSIGGICKIKTKKYRKIIWHFGVCSEYNILEEITVKNILYSSIKHKIFSSYQSICSIFLKKKSSEQKTTVNLTQKDLVFLHIRLSIRFDSITTTTRKKKIIDLVFP